MVAASGLQQLPSSSNIADGLTASLCGAGPGSRSGARTARALDGAVLLGSIAFAVMFMIGYGASHIASSSSSGGVVAAMREHTSSAAGWSSSLRLGCPSNSVAGTTDAAACGAGATQDPVEQSLLSTPADALVVPTLQEVVTGRRIALVSHDMTPTGAPRVTCELALLLSLAGAEVTVTVPREGLVPYGEVAPTDPTAQQEALQRQVAFLLPHVSSLPFRVVCCADDYSLVAPADLVIASTAHPRMSTWITGFRTSPHTSQHGGLLWYVHEGASVMSEFDRLHTDQALGAMTTGLLDGILFVSWSAQQWWTGMARQKGLFRFPTVMRVLHWSLPPWRLDRITAARKDATAMEARRTGLGIAPHDFVITILSSFNPLKGHAGIFGAFRRAQEQCEAKGSGGGEAKWHLIAAGHGSDTYSPPGMPWVRSSPSVHLLPAVSDPEALLAISDAYVSNSQRGGESWGLAALEALASGAALLAAGSGGTLEQVQDGVSALLHQARGQDFAAEDERQLAGNMCALAQDGALRSGLVLRGTRLAEGRFGPQALQADIAAHLGAMLQRRSGHKTRPRPVSPKLGDWTPTRGGNSPPAGCSVLIGGGTGSAAWDANGAAQRSSGGDGGRGEGEGDPPGDASDGSLCLPPLGSGASEGGDVDPLPLPLGSLPFDAGLGIWGTTAGAAVGGGGLAIVAGGLFTGGAGSVGAFEAPHALGTVSAVRFPLVPGAGVAAVRVPLPPLPRGRRRPLVLLRAGSPPLPPGDVPVVTVHVLGGGAADGALAQGSHFALTLSLPPPVEEGAVGGVVAVGGWVELPPLPLPSSDSAGVAIESTGGGDEEGDAGSQVFVFGGQRGCSRPMCSTQLSGSQQHPLYGEMAAGRAVVTGAAFRYSVAQGTWHRLLDLQVPVAEASAVSAPHRSSVMVVGGRVDASQWTAVVQEWSLARREWTVHELSGSHGAHFSERVAVWMLGLPGQGQARGGEAAVLVAAALHGPEFRCEVAAAD